MIVEVDTLAKRRVEIEAVEYEEAIRLMRKCRDAGWDSFDQGQVLEVCDGFWDYDFDDHIPPRISLPSMKPIKF